MFDSHCHVQHASVDASAVMVRAHAAGVTQVLMAGVDPADWAAQRALNARLPTCLMAFGWHPQVLATAPNFELAAAMATLEQQLAHAPHALGEIGLDSHTSEHRATLAAQEKLFRAQLRLAHQHNLPVLLHILGAHGRALEILSAEGVPARGGVVHSYSGSRELVARYVALGLHVAFSGSVTNPRARRAREACVAVPPERLLVETDAPYQTPHPHRPGANEPAFLASVVQSVAELRRMEPARVAEITHANAARLFCVDSRATPPQQ